MVNNGKCVFCKSYNVVFQYSTYDLNFNKYKIIKCDDCNTFSIVHDGDESFTVKPYEVDYYGEGEKKFKAGMVENVLDKIRASRAKKLIKYVGNNSKVLDIGCGNGNFLKYLNIYGNCDIYGTEIEGNSAKRALEVKNINLKIGELNDRDFPDDFFDGICMIHVFEHLYEPQNTISIIKKILKPGGILRMSFPNIASWQSRLFKGKWLHLDPPRHTFFMSPDDFESMMKLNNFGVIKRSFFSVEQNPYGSIQSILNLFQKKREVLFEFMKGNKNHYKDYSKANLAFQRAFFYLSFPFFVVSDIIASVFNKGATVEYFLKKNK